MNDKAFQDKVQAEFYSIRPTAEPKFETPINKLTQQAPTSSCKYANKDMESAVGLRITAYMIGCTVYPEVGSVITYQWGQKKIYDVLDVPGVSKESNDKRKMRYMQMFGTKPGTVQKALGNPWSFSASVGTQWGHHVKCLGRKLEAILEVYKAPSGYIYFGLVSGKIV